MLKAAMEREGDDVTGQTPLKGVVLCCTSLTTDVRTKLAEVATQMGAKHKLDLTADVTHLIVGSIATPKYQYVAKERPDIKVLAPSWVEAVREAWMNGGDVDESALEALQKSHKLPVFSDLNICVTGFDDMEERTRLSEAVVQQGAAYHGDLTKQVTHLIARKPSGAKYTHARQWGIKVVSLKWFTDSLKRGMALDEALYDPNMLETEQGVGAFRTEPRPVANVKRKRESSDNGAERGNAKLRRSTSTRLESHSQDMLSHISARQGAQAAAVHDRWQDDSTSESTPKPAGPETQRVEKTVVPLPQDAPQGFFNGCYVLLWGFDCNRTKLLDRHLRPNDATVVDTFDELEDATHYACFRGRYLMVPAEDATVEIPYMPPGTKIVTEWWLERCIHAKRFLEPDADVLSRPLAQVRVPGFDELAITIAGFVGTDFRMIAKAVKLIGATYQEEILKGTSVIIAASSAIKREKAAYAQDRGIPVVSLDWLWRCIEGTQVAAFDEYKIRLPTASLADFGGDASASSPASGEPVKRPSSGFSKSKDIQPPTRLSTTRRKQATPSLALQTSRTPAPAARQPPPFIHEDDDGDPVSIDTDVVLHAVIVNPSDRPSRPLQELSPNRSPRKSSQSTDDRTIVDISSETIAKPSSRTVSPEKDAQTEPMPSAADPVAQEHPSDPPATHARTQQLHADMLELLSRSRPASASGPKPPRRKSRALGRAASGISNHSFTASAPSENADANDIDGFTTPVIAEPAPPSTQLGYETAGADEVQAWGTERDGLSRVASVGAARDSGGFAAAVATGDKGGFGAGVAGRVKGRGRAGPVGR